MATRVKLMLTDGKGPLFLPREHAYYQAVVRSIPGQPGKCIVVLGGSQHSVEHSPEDVELLLAGEPEGRELG